MGDASEQRFSFAESCLDYHAYVFVIDPELSPARYAAICQRLVALGRAEEERMGVTYVHAPWGFMVIPSHGFPELRVNFYHDIAITEIHDVMAAICASFDATDVVSKTGGGDE